MKIISAFFKRHRFATLATIHFINDIYSTCLPTFLPYLLRHLSLSIGQGGTLNAFFGLIHIVGQPTFGIWADRMKRPWFAFFGPILTVWGACLIPLVPNYGSLLLVVFIFSMGTAMFHPQGFGLCGSVVSNEKLNFRLATFAATGTLGSALSPVYIVYVWQNYGNMGFLATALVTLAFPFFFRMFSYESKTENHKHNAPLGQLWEVLKKVRPILMLSIVRDATSQGIRFFIPLLTVMRGGTMAQGGFILLMYTLATTASGMVAGRIADKIGTTRLVYICLGAAPVLLLPGVMLRGWAGVALLVAGGAILSASNPVTTAMAQRATPESRSTASSLVMGVSWGMANWITSPVGYAADAWGLNVALAGVCFLPWICITFAFLTSRFMGRKGSTA